MSADSTAERETVPGKALAERAVAGKAVAGKALRGAGRTVRQHKVATAIGGVFAAAVVVVSLVGSRAGAPAAGPAAPGFTVAALSASGQGAGQIALSQYRGKPLIVNFWASWCAPCQRETPLLAHWYSAEHGHVRLIGIDVHDSAANALKFARAKGIGYPIGADPSATVAAKYGVVALPQTFFLNAQHRIVDHVFGAVTQAGIAAGVRLMDASGS
jgi:cytochrome c biogenesis protein CcmG, thiol:disulfide interchange protein DsbE